MDSPKSETEILEEVYKFFVENIKNPAELLAFIDDDLNNGVYKFHKWQAQIHTREFSKQYTSADYLELCIRAVNGSGKDEKVIAPAALFLICANKSARVVITSSSGRQLTDQTEKYISRFANLINKYLSYHFQLKEIYEFLIVQKRKIVCKFSEDSEILMFATDDEGKAEGYHPIKAGAVFAMIMNEAKSIQENIWTALVRCNGYTHWIEVSSPGKAEGHFYNKCTSSRTKTLSNGETIPAVIQYIITSDDCPHLGGEQYKEKLAEDLGSKENWQYKSMVDCEFGSGEEQVVIDAYKYNRLIKYQTSTEWVKATTNTGGLDLAFGGDEICLQVRNGNKHLGKETLKSKDTTFICITIVGWVKKWNLEKGIIYADGGGLGEVIISLLKTTYGLKNIVMIKNNWASTNERLYENLGAESWFQLGQLIENQDLIINDEPILRQQLCNRYFIINKDNVSQLESKQKARAKGRLSPDRADALVLCFYKYKTPKQVKTKEQKDKEWAEYKAKHIQRIPTINLLVNNNIKQERFNNKYSFTGTTNASDKKSKTSIHNMLRKELQDNYQRALLKAQLANINNN